MTVIFCFFVPLKRDFSFFLRLSIMAVFLPPRGHTPPQSVRLFHVNPYEWILRQHRMGLVNGLGASLSMSQLNCFIQEIGERFQVWRNLSENHQKFLNNQTIFQCVREMLNDLTRRPANMVLYFLEKGFSAWNCRSHHCLKKLRRLWKEPHKKQPRTWTGKSHTS